ncbi:MAG: Crp/Fnr family transcriptional regulator [Maribacter sp.]|uniref:Crp/Fnr family transcriptional regulator n=1 Tax=Maribacter sp. TaxID=1897614 RepID=UPI0032967DE3
MNTLALRTAYQHELLTEKDLTQVCAAHHPISFSKGAQIVETDTIADGYLVLESGLIRSYVIDFNGKDITTNFFTQGEIVIEVSSLFQRIPAKESIEALTDCVGWKIDFQDFQKLFHTLEGFREWGRAWMANSLFEFKQRSVAMIADSATERYHKLMETKPEVFQHSSLKHIASYLGVTDTSLSRIRKETAKA